MNWILDEVRESIKNKITVCESFMELCDSQIKLYKDRYSTNDLQVACNYEYWRACKIRTAYEIKDLKEILQEIDAMMPKKKQNFYLTYSKIQFLRRNEEALGSNINEITFVRPL